MDANQKKYAYSLIIPVHNEEKFLRQNLNSVVNQRLQPLEVIIVDDGSTDKSVEIAQEFAQKFDFIKPVSSGDKTDSHQPGSKIVNAFYKGFEQLTKDWDFIVKLDADVILPQNYFEIISETFKSDHKTGIAGGIAFIEKNGEWKPENIGDKKQVRGPFKAYTKECFEKIGGIRPTIGWDTLDEMIAQYQGFKITVLPDLIVKLQKPTGTNYKKIHAQKTGQAFYKMGYGLLISLIAAAKDAWKKQRITVFFSIMSAYFSSALKSESKAVTAEEAKFIRQLRWRGVLNKFGINK